jgi:hypothetical protein
MPTRFQFPTRFSIPWEYSAAFSDETTALTTGTKLEVSFPYDVMVSDFYISVTTAPTGTSLIVDVTKGGLSIFSKAVTVPVSTKNSRQSGAVSFVVRDSFIPAFTALPIVINQVGSTIAGAGGKFWFVGFRAN